MAAFDAHHARAIDESPNRPGPENADTYHAHGRRHIDCDAAAPGPPHRPTSGRGPGSRRLGDGHEGARHLRGPSSADRVTYR